MDNGKSKQGKQTSLVNRRNFIIGAVLASASAIAYTRQPEIAEPVVEAEAFDKLVPKAFGNWMSLSQGEVILPPPDALQDRLYDNLVTRVYAKSGSPPVMMLLAYNNEQDGVLQVHRPEVCYPVGGFQLTETRQIGIAGAGRSIPANIFTAKSPRRTEQVVYFTRLGNAFPRSWSEQRISVMRANLAGDIPDGMMMRVSVLGGDQQKALSILTEFTREFIESSPRHLQKLLIG
tara:strand:- start:437 stop:1135 length:699 start_codon:yes stop_codon:yes gene_type:complete